MINKMEKYTIINSRKKGMSFRKIALELGIDRKTVSRICHTYFNAQEVFVTRIIGFLWELQQFSLQGVKLLLEGCFIFSWSHIQFCVNPFINVVVC